jgi:uncharacterized protein YdeI (YjbR/CyaY-like superfamily)
MPVTTSPAVDDYIYKAELFAQPLLIHLRGLVHKNCSTVVETIKWGFPHFEYNKGNMCSMASFKQHCAFGFWLAPIMKDPDKIFVLAGEKGAMGHLGQIKTLSDLPSEAILSSYIQEAMQLIDSGAKLKTRKVEASKKELIIPSYFTSALESNIKAKACFEAFSYSNKKEYLDWITEAKTEATRNKRLDQAFKWMAEGKIRNWKYVK